MNKSHRYLSLNAVKNYESEMKRLKVSEVARSPRGFLTAYKKAKSPDNLSDNWKEKREGFIARHGTQYKKKPTNRRKLALIGLCSKTRIPNLLLEQVPILFQKSGCTIMSRDNWKTRLNIISIPLHYIRWYNPLKRRLRGRMLCQKALLSSNYFAIYGKLLIIISRYYNFSACWGYLL